MLVDIFLTAVIAEATVKKISGAGFGLIVGITDINWFIIYSCIILLIRKRETLLDIKTYLKVTFLRYIRALFIFMLLEIIFVGLVIMLGITQFPTIHWALKILFQIFELIIIFYWLDSTGKFKDFITSIEKTANLILYNLPVFLIFFGVFLGLDFLLKLLTGTEHASFATLLFNNNSSQLFQSAVSRFAEIKLIFIKYMVLVFEILCLCILFAFYDENKRFNYSKSIFEYNEENDSN
jgi:hypothetical protein